MFPISLKDDSTAGPWKQVSSDEAILVRLGNSPDALIAAHHSSTVKSFEGDVEVADRVKYRHAL